MNWAAAVNAALGEPARTLLVWTSGHGSARLVYAFPSRRLATLRHWRDEVETPEFVGLEASKWARLMLKGHGGTLLQAAEAPSYDPRALSESLAALAVELWTPAATAWAERMGRPAMSAPSTGITSAERFERVDAWLEAVRVLVDADDDATRAS